jgi:hypothetical protein
VQSVVGTTLSRVVALTDPGSIYRVEAGGTVALVCGTVFAHHVDPSGDITVAVSEGDVNYPGPDSSIRRGEKRTVNSRGDGVDSRFDPVTTSFSRSLPSRPPAAIPRAPRTPGSAPARLPPPSSSRYGHPPTSSIRNLRRHRSPAAPS